MRRYIDADALKKWVEEYPSSNWGIPQDELIYAIGSAPTIDPVKHGGWIEREVSDSKDIDALQSAKCSVCGRYHTIPYMYSFREDNYCPHCGAKMVQGEEEQ